ncbi:MAG: patatin-like phospholipase family protein [Pseudomonadota bacterium]
MTTFSLALGAGGARGLAHLHVLRAFDDLGIRPQAMAGTSIGAIMAAGYCAGMDAREIEAFVEGRINNRLKLLQQIFRTVPSDFETFLRDGGLRIGELNLERILEVFLPEQIPMTFAQLRTPLAVVATKYHAETDAVFKTGSIRPALAASASMPAVFLPVQVGGEFHTDGSATNPVPMNVISPMADFTIGVDVAGGSLGEPGKRPHMVDVAYAANGLMQRTMARQMAEALDNATLLRAPVAQFRPLDFLKARQILSETSSLHDETKRLIERLAASGERPRRS